MEWVASWHPWIRPRRCHPCERGDRQVAKEKGSLPPHPFEVDAGYLESHLDALIDVTFRDIQSQFLLMPHGPNFMEFASFHDAYEVLKQ